MEIRADNGVAPGRRKRVLVVDDSPDVAELLAEVVGLLGHDVIVAETGMEALAAAVRSEPDLVLLDIGLPDVSGHEVARRLRQCCSPAMQIVAITGWGQDDDRRQSEAAGFDLHLVKPVRVEALRELLERGPRASRWPRGGG